MLRQMHALSYALCPRRPDSANTLAPAGCLERAIPAGENPLNPRVTPFHGNACPHPQAFPLTPPSTLNPLPAGHLHKQAHTRQCTTTATRVLRTAQLPNKLCPLSTQLPLEVSLQGAPITRIPHAVTAHATPPVPVPRRTSSISAPKPSPSSCCQAHSSQSAQPSTTHTQTPLPACLPLSLRLARGALDLHGLRGERVETRAGDVC